MGKIKYQKCDCCGKEFPKNITYFKKYSHKTENGLNFHTTCRICEEKLKYNTEWEDGKLLCHICGKYLDPEHFNLAGGNKYSIRNGRDKRCSRCKLEQNKQARENYSENVKLQKVLQERWLGAKDRATIKGIPFSISKEDLVELWNNQDGLCSISKIPMTFELDKGRVFTNVSLDQKNPGQGYTKDNIQLVCSAVNQLKSNWDMDTVVYICKQIVNNYG